MVGFVFLPVILLWLTIISGCGESPGSDDCMEQKIFWRKSVSASQAAGYQLSLDLTMFPMETFVPCGQKPLGTFRQLYSLTSLGLSACSFMVLWEFRYGILGETLVTVFFRSTFSQLNCVVIQNICFLYMLALLSILTVDQCVHTKQLTNSSQ